MTDGLRRIEVRGPIELDLQLRPEPVHAAPSGPIVDRLPGLSGATRKRYEVVIDGWRFEVTVEPARHAQLRERAARAAADHAPATGTTIRAQIPGRVVRVWVGEGDTVEQGQRLLSVEAMKMENEVRAPQAGVVESVGVTAGSKVERDDVLVRLGQTGGAT